MNNVKYYARKLTYVTILAATISILKMPTVLAYPEFKPGKIIDDAVFTNKYSMSSEQIQSFLNSQMPSCNTLEPGYTGGSGTIYSPPWICLKDYYENPTSTYIVSYSYIDKDGSNKTSSVTYYRNNAYEFTSLTPAYINGDFRQGIKHLTGTIKTLEGIIPPGAKSAAQIIYEAAQQYTINPQVLLVILQKEQGLITDSSPEPWRYQAAMGYECDDSSPCKSQFAGFSKQVLSSAWQLRNDFNGIDTPGFWSLYGKGLNNILFNPDRACGSSEVNIENQATAVLYKYTPYQPNAGSIAHKLNGGRYYSTLYPDCGAYGNLNFWKLFYDWFGDPLNNLFTPMSRSRYMQIRNSGTYKKNIFTGENAGLALESGRQIKFVDKINVGGLWYLRTEWNFNNGDSLYGILLSDLEEIPYISITPKWMTFIENGNRSHPASRTAVGTILVRGTSVRVVDEIIIDGTRYYRTEFAKNNNLDVGIHNKFLIEFAPIALDNPRDFCTNNKVYLINPQTKISTTQIDAGRYFVSKKTLIDGVWYFQREIDEGTLDFINSGNLYTTCYENFTNPRKLKVINTAKRINPYTGITHDYIEANRTIEFATKIYINNLWYYRSKHNTLNNIDAVILSSDTAEL